MFSTFYESPWHHPGIAWAAGLLLFAFAALYKLGRLRGLGRLRIEARLWLYVLFELFIVADALLTGGLSPLAPKGTAASRVSIAFVLLGDARYYFLLFSDEERAMAADRSNGKNDLRAAALAAVCCAILPLAASLLQRYVPTLLPTPRHLFLCDELFLLIAAVAISIAISRRKDAPGKARRLRLSLFVAAQYGLWVLADVLILSGGSFVEPGFALRLVPNTLYYAAFVPFAAWTAERCARPPARSALLAEAA